ncbi:integrating conjugative element protein (plasmid) [Ralstonia solanacearum]|nr:integrating conjugative element protein [Ralstonia solanacearum]
MNRLSFVLPLGLLVIAAVHAQTTTVPLTVVEDRGGISALPYYQALNPQSTDPAATPPTSTPRLRTPADAEAAMLPIRSARLSPGIELHRAIQAPGLTPVFLVGDDDRSRAWLRQQQTTLRNRHAVGLVVNVASPNALASLRRLAPGLQLSPASGDELAERLGIRHYPVLITATGIEP